MEAWRQTPLRPVNLVIFDMYQFFDLCQLIWRVRYIVLQVNGIDASSRRDEIVLFQPGMIAPHGEMLSMLRRDAPDGQHIGY